MANISKSNVFPTITKVHIKDTFILYNNLVKNAMKYQSAMVALATAVNDLSHSYDDFLSYAPMRAIIESSGQQNDIHNTLKIFRILYESFKKMGEFLNRDFALPLNDDFKSMQVKFSDKKIEKTLKLEEKQRTKSLIPGVLPEPSNIQRGLFQQYISAIKFVTRKTRKLQYYESHVFERMIQGIKSYEDKNSNIYNSFSLNQSMSRDNYEEPTPRLNYLSGVNKKSFLDVSQLDNATFEENIFNHDNNPLTNSFIKDEIKKSELNGDQYFQYSNHSPVNNDNFKDKFLRDNIYGNDKEMENNVNTNSSDYSKRDYHHHRYTTSNVYEMKYIANKYEDKNGNMTPSLKENQYRNRSKSLGSTQNTSDKYKQNHYSMPVNKNSRYSVPVNVNANEKRDSENHNNRFSTIKSHSSSSSSGKSALSQTHSLHNKEDPVTKNDMNNQEPETNEEADTTITEDTVKKESKKLHKKSSIKNDLKKNLSDMKNKLHKRRSTNNSPVTKPVSILKNKISSKDKEASESGTTIGKGDDLSKLQDIINQEDSSNDEEEFIVISKKKMDNLIRTGKVHSIDDILKKNKHSSVSSSASETKEIVESPKEMKNDIPLNEKEKSTVPPKGFVDETPNLANESTPVLAASQPPKSMENVPNPMSKHTRSSSYGGISQSHIRGMASNLASKHFPSIVPNGYATPMLSHQEPTINQTKFNKSVPMEYATPMLPHFQNNNTYSPMLKNDVPSVNGNDDITPPSRRAKSTYSIQNLLNNWPNFEELTKTKENHPIFNNRKNSLPIYDRKTPLAASPITADSQSMNRPTVKITSAPNDKALPKKKGVNWDDNNKEYLIPNTDSSKSNEESYYDDIINNTYGDNEESSMMINDPTRLIFSRFNTSASNVSNISSMTEESSLQTPTLQTPTPMDSLTVPNRRDNKRLNGLRNIITRDVLEDELPPTPISPTVADNTRLNGATAFEPDMPIRGESLHFIPKSQEFENKKEEKKEEEEKEKEEEEKNVVEEIHGDFDKEIVDEEELLTPIEKVDVSVIEETEIIDVVDNHEVENHHINDNEIHDADLDMDRNEPNGDGNVDVEDDVDGDGDDDDEDSEDDVKLADIPRFNKAILRLKVKRSANFDGELASPCPTPTTYMINKIKEIEDKNKEKSDDELDYNSEEDLDILRFISYRRAPEVLEKHLKENESEEESRKEEKGEYTTTKGNENPEDPFNYNEGKKEGKEGKEEEDKTEEIELSDIENEIIDTNMELEMPKKMDRKDSVKSVISNISSKFSQKLNSMFSNSESSTTAINSSENESQSKEDNELSVMTETTIDENALKENIREQKEELTKSMDALNFARKFSSDFIKGGSELIRRSSKDSIKSLTRKFSTQSDSPKPEEMETLMQKSNSIKSEIQRRNSSASLTTHKENTSIISDDRSIKTTITSASLPRKDSLIRVASVKKNTSVRSVATSSSNLTSTPIINPAVEEEDDVEETPRVENFPERPERPERPIPQRPATPNAPNTPVFPNIKLCNILMNHEEPSPLDDQDGNDIIVISNPLLEVTNNKNLADYKNDLPDERREFRISRNEAYMTFDLCQNAVDIESAMGSIIDPDDDSRMEMLNGESSLSFRSINPSLIYEEKDSVILTAPKLKKGKKPELEIDTKAANTSKVVAIIPSPIPQKDNNFTQKFNNLNTASLIQETREQQQSESNNKTNNSNIAMKKYVALYPYNARDGRELSFQRADIINVRREQGEWVYGFKENLIEDEEIKYGWVPKSYLKIITIF
ncbi:hypothetical protein PIROE2DRAFT_57006 [Piromyces sp. E2]|nr:hypothetical protein PIROE2DRAFT_57006 [Piromyces sp. E2]|eukprot:OUM70138.1 hypothetical protein PIROE2DRAFT_57006 [Piromyces sp. E2]